jgi:transcription antitermination factor NusG
MSGIRQRRRQATMAPAEVGNPDELLRRTQTGILTKITGALDLQVGLAAITASVGFAPGRGVGFEVGETVTITGGPFADLPATINPVNHVARTLQVLISVFGRQTRIEVTFDQVVSSDDVG